MTDAIQGGVRGEGEKRGVNGKKRENQVGIKS